MTSPSQPRLGRALLWLLLALAASIAIMNWNVRDPHPGAVPEPANAPVADQRSDLPAWVEHRQPQPALVKPGRLPTPAGPLAIEDPAIEDVESHCRPITTFGRCEGDVAKACVANSVVSVDCAARHGRCAMTDEGAQCLPHRSDDPSECTGSETATCSGSTLSRCVDGLWTRLDCAARKAACETTRDGARCATDMPAPPRAAVEVCDGIDNDADGRVDESGACDAVKLVAFIAKDHQPADFEVRMRVELSILNRVFAPMVFQWAKTVQTEAPREWLLSDFTTPVARKLARGELDGFYIPILFVSRLATQPPKGGWSTLPNNHCGGERVSDAPSPPEGLIVVSEARQLDTLAHEMGHYLGLCHTFYQLAPVASRGPEVAECNLTGDGICDTPPDPGPEKCARGPDCALDCGNAAAPDPTNIMSYYVGCRRLLTAEQLAEARRNLALRRGWFPCLDPKACTCDPGAPGQCPAEMSCEPSETLAGPWTCNLDGPALPGVACIDPNQCSAGSFCLQQSSGERLAAHCVRPCREGDLCTCTDVGLAFRVCREDLPFALDTGRAPE
jgi:hypothetical protein